MPRRTPPASEPPRASIVVPVFNGAGYLPDALPRLLAQRHDAFEVVVVDDGSADGSADLVRAAATDDDRLRLIALVENGGVARARQAGVAAARGEYVWFVDADDDWRDDALARLVEAADRDRLDVVVAGARFVYDGGSSQRALPAPTGGPVDGRTAFEALLTGGISGHLWNKLFRRELASALEFTPARVHSDLAMVADALSRAGRVGFLDATIYDYRLRSGSIITSRSSRAASLELIGDAVDRAAARLDPALVDTDAFRYFRTRFLVLSSLKDGVQGPYSPAESRDIVRAMRRRLAASDLAVLARRRDARRLLLALAAKTSLPLYRGLLRAAER
ncbi:glycosyltransferase [Agromyces intestinalis]|uniref:Glycosyltransferase n=1 Tax=Agromyces intestinalis TaxID=2592652 RepID=A0A5C1YDJ1_9MICO|nr:glycosyltransferase [Agromyces intestinalis]QEO14171.1 glycosyltransferase [Agromyces intestinalis]